jgi:cell wall-associated NlpC family hydrolase
VVAVALLGSFAAPAFTSGPVGADPIDDKRAEAARLADEIEENGARISMLDEELLDAQQRITELDTRIADAEAQMDGALADARSTRHDLEGRAAALYMAEGSGATILPELQGDTFAEAGARHMYLSAAAARDNAIIDSLKATRSRLAEQKDALEDARQQIEAERARLDTARAELDTANARQQELLAETEGELADLIAEEQARREAEAAEAARREQEARDAAADDSGSGDSDGGDDSGGGGGDPPIDVVAPNPRAQVAVDAALAQIGKPYSYATPSSWDVEDPDTFDCSGLTGWAWAQAGYYLPHQSRAQFAALPHVSQDELLPGDLVFYGSPIHHVGMYIGNGEYVNAPYTGAYVRIGSIYRDDWAGGARVPG